MIDLGPCPACHQKEAHVIERLKESMVLLPEIAFVAQCQACEFCGPERDRPCDAAAAWNRRASPWQPIETAPKDGSCILVWPPTWEGVASCARWDKDEYKKKPKPYWRRIDGSGIQKSREKPPTHWMPLPEPPETE